MCAGKTILYTHPAHTPFLYSCYQCTLDASINIAEREAITTFYGCVVLHCVRLAPY